MNLTDQITQFFDAGVVEIKIYRPTDGGGNYVVQAIQNIRCDKEAGQMNVMHQAGAVNLVNALEDVRRRVNFCNEQAAHIL